MAKDMKKQCEGDKVSSGVEKKARLHKQNVKGGISSEGSAKNGKG